MFSPDGPSLRELCVQALTSVERGYDLLAPKFDNTPFRTPADILDATVAELAARGPFTRGVDVCCGTGAGLAVLERLSPGGVTGVDSGAGGVTGADSSTGGVTGVDFSAGMLAQARAAHPRATLVRADARQLPFTAAFDLAVTFGAMGHFLPSERPAVFV